VGKTLYIERIPGDIKVSMEDPNTPGTRRLLQFGSDWMGFSTYAVGMVASSGPAYVEGISARPATPDSEEQLWCTGCSIPQGPYAESAPRIKGCTDGLSCSFSTLDLANTQKKDSNFKLVVGRDENGEEVDLFSYFSPSAFVKAMASLTGKAICDLTFYGREIKNNNILAIEKDILAESAHISDAAAAAPLFQQLPVERHRPYMVGMFATGIPGLTDNLFPAFQIVTAFNPCSGDYLFAFNGVEIEGPVNGMKGTVRLETFGYSMGKKISSENLDSWKPWSPAGFKTTTFSGNVMVAAAGNLEVGFKEGVVVDIKIGRQTLKEVYTSFVLNSDPKGDGNVGDNAQDFQLLVKLKGGPYFQLLDGKLKFDFKDYTSITGLLHAEWWDTSRYTFAAQLKVDLSPGDFFKAIQLIPKIVGDVINAMMPIRLNTIDFYIDQSDWGVRVIMGVGSVDGNPLKFLDDIVPGLNVYSDILQHIPGVSSIPAFKGGFGLSGKMSGNGMPVNHLLR
jgi:hypothetical protein